MSEHTICPRTNISWRRNDYLRILKMLAWVIYDRERIRNAHALEQRIAKEIEATVAAVLGEQGVTLDYIKAHTLSEQGLEITAHKLLQRADKTDRYDEFNELVNAVEQHYEARTRVIPPVAAEATVSLEGATSRCASIFSILKIAISPSTSTGPTTSLCMPGTHTPCAPGCPVGRGGRPLPAGGLASAYRVSW